MIPEAITVLVHSLSRRVIKRYPNDAEPMKAVQFPRLGSTVRVGVHPDLQTREHRIRYVYDAVPVRIERAERQKAVSMIRRRLFRYTTEQL